MPSGSAGRRDQLAQAHGAWCGSRMAPGGSRAARPTSSRSEGLQVRLSEAPGFGQGDEVAVRLSFERGAATVAVTARVAWLRGAAGQVECGLEWSTPPSERKDLEAWLAKAA